jgi:hypothetical protein
MAGGGNKRGGSGAMRDARQVICMKWGARYPSTYVNRLYAMVRSRVRGPLRFVCLTDDVRGVNPKVECHDCPEIELPLPHRLRGWRKLNLFAPSERLFGLTGDWLFLDLDVVVTGALDDFFTYRPDESFVVMQNWTQPGRGIGNTSVFRFRVGAHPYLPERCVAEFDRIHRAHRNEQVYVSREITSIAFWPDEWCLLFKVQCVPPWPARFWRAPVLPESARVVAFPGSPDPHEAADGQWPCRNRIKKIYKHIRPARWITETWDAAEKRERISA